MDDRLHHLIFKWLRQLQIPVSAGYIHEKLLSHPHYPSLLSITDTLDDLGIENAALVVDKAKLKEIPAPFMAHTGTRGGEFILVRNIRKHLKKYPGFEKDWDGTVVAAEKPGSWKNKENDRFLAEVKKKKVFHWLGASAILLLVAFSLPNQFSWQNPGLLITSLAGLAIAILIVQHELGISNEITDQLCGADRNTDCDAVMKSKGSKILTWFNPIVIGWADAGIIYFSSMFLLLTISFFTETIQSLVNILSLLATCSLFFTLYSVYYQWRVVKKWCLLCLATVAILWVQFILLVPDLQNVMRGTQKITMETTGYTAFLLTFTAILWLGLAETCFAE